MMKNQLPTARGLGDHDIIIAGGLKMNSLNMAILNGKLLGDAN